MPFTKVYKEGEEPSGFTGVNVLKNLWKARADDVTATPKQRQRATTVLSMLNANTTLMKKMMLIELLSESAERIGYKITTDIDLLNPSLDPVEDLADGVLKYLTGGSK